VIYQSFPNASCLVPLSLLNTATLTKVLNSTVVSYQPSLIVETEYATSTAIFTTTQPGVTLPASTFYQDPSTAYVTLDPSTVVVTLEQPVVTITPQPLTVTSTPGAETLVVVSYLNMTETIPLTLPQDTAYITPTAVTSYVTLTLQPEATTVYVPVTLPPLVETSRIGITLPAETEVQTFTLPAETQTQDLTLPPVTATTDVLFTVTAPQITETLVVSQTVTLTQTFVFTQPGPTITITITSLPPSQPSPNSTYVPPASHGVPAIALSRPTAIAGSVDGAPYNSDDDDYSVNPTELYYSPYPADSFDRSHSLSISPCMASPVRIFASAPMV
jgi:hypothetical protein